MKNSTIYTLRGLLALAAVCAFSTVRAEEPASAKEKDKTVGPMILKKFDANGDGVLDEKEKAAWEADKAAKRAAMEAKRVEKFDTNKDGKLDETELAAEKAEKAAKKEAAAKKKASEPATSEMK